jgi:hypothetical protein
VNSVTQGSQAVFSNLVGLYEVVDAQGGIDTNGDGQADVRPGQGDYARTALTTALVKNFTVLAGGEFGDTAQVQPGQPDVLLVGGKRYAPFVIANGGSLGSINEFIRTQSDTRFNSPAQTLEDAVVYFAFAAANPDFVDAAQANQGIGVHLRSYGNGVYGFEDLPDNLSGVSDKDFNDAVFAFNLTSLQ